jgi:PD-(D/E)XK endonuclease
MSSSVRDAKRQGELAELVFAHRAASRGWRVSKPLGESCAYDFVVDVDGALRRVQVKSVAAERAGTYRVASGSGRSSKRPYTKKDIDVMAAYVIPEDAWYLIPVEFCGVKSIHLCPHRESRRKFEKFREAWEI